MLPTPKYISIIEYLCGFSVVEEYLEKTLSVLVSLELIVRLVELGGSSWLVADLSLLWSCWVVVSLEWRGHTALGLRSAEEHTEAANTLQLLWSFSSSHSHFLTIDKYNFIHFIYSFISLTATENMQTER